MTSAETASSYGISTPCSGETHAYADGACSGNPGPGGWASVVVSCDGLLTDASGGEAMTTNNRMELMAAADAVTRGAAVSGTVRLVVHVDSTYVKDGIGGWVAGWKRNGWRTSSGAPVKNRDLWQALDAAVVAAKARGGKVDFAWVRGHAGHPGNERCDMMARRAIAVLKARRGTSSGVLAIAALMVAFGVVLAEASAARADDAAAPITLSRPVQGGYIVDGGAKGDWGFMMGPTGSPSMTMKLIRANPDKSGAVGFMCSKADGAMRMAVVLPGVSFQVGKVQDVRLTVGDVENRLEVIVRSPPPPGQTAVMEAAGLAIPDILKAMGQVPDGRSDARLRFDDGAGHVASFGLPKPRGVALDASRICSGWALAMVPRDSPQAATIGARANALTLPATGQVDIGGINGGTAPSSSAPAK